jgi:glycosyltransferase involved in cell wall biosynthesis
MRAADTSGATPPEVSVVIRTRDEEEHLPRLLDALATQTLRPREVLVVDSGSADRTVIIAKQHHARVLEIAPESFTFGRALNLGFREASGDFVVAASAHVYPERRDWLERLVQPLEADPKVALSYGRQQGDERSHYSEFELMRRWFPLVSNADQTHPFCNNANCAVRREVWEQLPYDEDLTGLEDLDWAKRAMSRGWKIAYAADAPIVHIHEESFGVTVRRYRREAQAYRRVFDSERLSILEAVALFAVNVGRDYLAAARRGVLASNIIAVPRFRLAQFWGAYTGFRVETVLRARLKRRYYYPRGFDSWAVKGQQ